MASVVSAQSSKKKTGFVQKVRLLGAAELLLVLLLLIGGLSVCAAAVQKLNIERKTSRSLNRRKRIKRKRGPGGSVARIGLRRKKKLTLETTASGEKRKSTAARLEARKLEQEKEQEKEEEKLAAEERKVEENLSEEETGAAEGASPVGGAGEAEALLEKEPLSEEEEAPPPDFYFKQEKKEKKAGLRIEKISQPSSTLPPPIEEVGFSVRPLPKRVHFSPYPISGSKRAFTSVWLNGAKVVGENRNTGWVYRAKLKKGENRLVFSSRDVYGTRLVRLEAMVVYEPPVMEKPKISSLVSGSLAVASPTFFATPSAESLSDPKLAPLLSPKKKTFSRSAYPSGSPRIYSPTHPRQDRWYRNSSPKFVWEENTFWVGYLVSLARLPVDPVEDIGGKTRTSYQNLDDGVWYFGVKGKTDDGRETPANFYRILIDHAPPKIKNLKITDASPIYKNGSLINLEVEWSDEMFDSPYGQDNLPPTLPVAFLPAEEKEVMAGYLDDLNAIRRYVNADFSALDTGFRPENLMVAAPVKVGGNVFKTTLSYRISLENARADDGAVPVAVKVQDYAGNSAALEVNVALANDVPVSLEPSEETAQKPLIAEAVRKEGLTLSGTTVPNVDVTLYIYSEPFVATVRSDLSGNWEYTLREPLPPGNHAIYAQAKDRQGNSTPIVQIGAVTILDSAQAAEIGQLVNTLSKVPSKERFVPRAAAAVRETKLPTSPEEGGGNGLPGIVSAQIMMIVGLALFASGVASLVFFLKKKPV